MAKETKVPRQLYKRIKAARSNEEILATMHAHDKIPGTLEIVSGGAPPIRCSVQFATTRGERQNMRGPDIDVIIRKL